MKNNIYKQYKIIIILMLLISFTLINSFFLITKSVEQSKKNLNKIVIKGQFNLQTKKKIIHLISLLQKQKNFFSRYDLSINNILHQIPFTKNIYTKKKWPDIIYIYGTNIIPFVYWNNKYLIDNKNNNEIINPNIFQIQNIPFLFGPTYKKNEIIKYYKIINNILSNKKIFLKTVIVTKQYSWTLFTTNNIKIALGNIQNLLKLKKIMNILNILKYQQKQKIKYIDLRYKSGIAVKWVSQQWKKL